MRSIRETFRKAGYPYNFVNDTIDKFENPSEPDTLFPTHWFDERRTININLPYCKNNEKQSYNFINKLTRYTQGHFKFRIIWQTRKIASLFSLKDRISHPSNVIYEGKCETCHEHYIGETSRNFSVRKAEHEHKSVIITEPSRHLNSNPDHRFIWKILDTSKPWRIRRTKEALLIGRYQPSLNKQVSAFHLSLYPKGIT